LGKDSPTYLGSSWPSLKPVVTIDSIKPGLIRSTLYDSGLTKDDFDKTDGFIWLKIVPGFTFFYSFS